VGGGYDVGWIAADEWLNYTVNVATAGTYTLSVRVACYGAGGTIHVEANGTHISGTLTIPDTGGWQNWTTLTANVSLAAGVQVIKVVMDSIGSSGTVGNINWLRFTSGVAIVPGVTNTITLSGAVADAGGVGVEILYGSSSDRTFTLVTSMQSSTD
jgi:hypothetical protein